MSTLNVSTIHGLTQSTPVQFAVAPTFPTRPANDSSTASATTEFVGSALNAALAAYSASNKIFYAAGEPLPATDKGPIWHADYNSWMTWQSFTANGANYTGYASNMIGSVLNDVQSTPRKGYVLGGSLNLNRNTYAALRGWAIHNGLKVDVSTWSAGNLQIADNADGTTFRVYDLASSSAPFHPMVKF